MPCTIPEESHLQISHAAKWVPANQREAFVRTIADELAGLPEVGEGVVSRVITRAFKQSFNPPLETVGDQHRPQQLRKLTTARG
jgi:hypothetical protein